jgi:hypothetical protein
MRVYGGNFDGKNRVIIAARSAARAAEMLGVSSYAFRNFACETGNDREIKTAMAMPGVAFAKPDRPNTEFVAAQTKLKERSDGR